MENALSRRATPPEPAAAPSRGAGSQSGASSGSVAPAPGPAEGQTTTAHAQPPTSGVEERTRYQVLRSLGKGGTGEVHEGLLNTDSGAAEPVAIKVLLDNPDEVPGRLRQLIEGLQGLSHPHVVLPIGFVASSAGRVILSPYHRGLTLAEALRRLKRLGRPLSCQQAVQILDQVLSGLQFLHSLPTPLLHQSVKPSNIQLGSDGVVRLIDVGLLSPMASPANRSRGLAVMNMLPYMAPEQLVPENAANTWKPTVAADLYALGAVGYEMLAGRPLFDGSAARRELEIRVGFGVQDKVRALDGVYPGIAAILGQALAVQPKDRPVSAEAFRNLLKGLELEEKGESLERLMRELEALPERKTSPGAEATTVMAQPVPVLPPARGTSSGGAPTSPENEVRRSLPPASAAPPRVVERVPEHVLANMQGKPGASPVRLGILLGSLVLAAVALWWVDHGGPGRAAPTLSPSSVTTPPVKSEGITDKTSPAAVQP